MVVKTLDEAQENLEIPSQEGQRVASMKIKKIKATNLIDMISLKDTIQIDHHHLRKNINHFYIIMINEIDHNKNNHKS
jgi:hypothetical protein